MDTKRPLRVVMLEDDPFSVAIIKHYASQFTKFQLYITHLFHLDEALVFLDHNDVDIIFLDYRITSRITGLDVLEHIRAKGVVTPVIVITGSGNEEIAVAMMKAGAQDYLVKGNVTPSLLEASIEKSLARGSTTDKKRMPVQAICAGQASSAVCVVDNAGIVHYANEAFVHDWGWQEADSPVGKDMRGFFTDTTAVDAFLSVTLEKKAHTGEMIALRRDGTRFIVQYLASVSGEVKNGFSCVMISCIDVTAITEEEKKREALYKGVLETFALHAEEIGNIETPGHLHRIVAYTRLIAHRLRDMGFFTEQLTDEYIRDLGYASVLHDVGKWRTPNEILLKKTALTDADWQSIRQHPVLGAQMLSPLLVNQESYQYLKLVETVVLYHHERWDGSGYPQGLKEEATPLAARIVGLADMYEAMTQEKVYRNALSHETVYSLLQQQKQAFDPRLWQVFEKYHEEFQAIRESTAQA